MTATVPAIGAGTDKYTTLPPMGAINPGNPKTEEEYSMWGKDDVPVWCLPGDVNGDGRLGADDARTALRMSAKLETHIPQYDVVCADVNRDYRLTAGDARAILRASAKLDRLVYKQTLWRWRGLRLYQPYFYRAANDVYGRDPDAIPHIRVECDEDAFIVRFIDERIHITGIKEGTFPVKIVTMTPDESTILGTFEMELTIRDFFKSRAA